MATVSVRYIVNDNRHAHAIGFYSSTWGSAWQMHRTNMFAIGAQPRDIA